MASPLVAAWLRVQLTRLPTSSPQALVTIMQLAACCAHRPEQEWLQSFYSAAAGSLRQFTGSQASTLLTAISRLKLQPRAKWLDDFYLQAALQADIASPQEAVQTLDVMSSFHHVPPPEVAQAFAEEMQSNLNRCSPQQLASLAQALLQMDYGPKATWVQAYCDAVYYKLLYFETKQLLAALAALCQWNVLLTQQPSWAGICTQVQQKLAVMTPSNAVAALTLFSRSGTAVDPAALQMAISALQSSLQSLESDQLDDLLASVMRLGLMPSNQFMDQVLQVSACARGYIEPTPCSLADLITESCL